MPASSPSEQGALQGLLVVDLTRILAGPWCTQLLADYGAEVIKVERPRTGDDTRSWGPPWQPPAGAEGDDGADGAPRCASYFAATNRNKRSVTLDIATPAGQQALRELAARADVFVENYKVGDLARYGLDYASLRELNPRLIYCSITGYGQTGPYADRPGYDVIFQGEAGLMSVTGEVDGMPGAGPQKVGVAVSDLVTGMYACTAILAALQARHATGAGQRIDVALFDCTLAFGANLAFNHVVHGLVPRRYGNAHPTIVPYQPFRTRDSSVIVAVGNDSQWQRLCAVLDRPDLGADSRFRASADRVLNRDALVPELERAFERRGSEEWLALLADSEIPHGRINDYAQAFAHPQAVHRGMRRPIADSGGGISWCVANPVRFSQTPVVYRRSAPRLGQDNKSVLAR